MIRVLSSTYLLFTSLLLLPKFSWVQCFSPPLFTRQLSQQPSCLSAKTTLSEDTTWSVRLNFRRIPTEHGKIINARYTLRVRFLEEAGYEPPQGTVQQVDRDESQVTLTQSRWILSEDPNERKDGLWVWGLFKEPLYPFLLLQLTTAPIPLDGDDNDRIPSMQLYAQIDHRRDDKVGVKLNPTSDLSIRKVETVKADVFGAATADLYDTVSVGTLALQPTTSF